MNRRGQYFTPRLTRDGVLDRLSRRKAKSDEKTSWMIRMVKRKAQRLYDLGEQMQQLNQQAAAAQRAVEELEIKAEEARKAEGSFPWAFLGGLLKEKWRRTLQSRNAARRPRRKRGPNPANQLRTRALSCVLDEHPDITASDLIDILDADERITYDDHDVELVFDGDDIVIRDLASDAALESTTIPCNQLRTYLFRARNP